MRKELEQQVDDFLLQLEEIAGNHKQTTETMEEQKKTEEELYAETYKEALRNVAVALPKVKAVLDVIDETTRNNPETLERFTYLLGEASGVVGVYVKEIVAAAYTGRAEGIADSYEIFKQKFGSTVALELIKQIR